MKSLVNCGFLLLIALFSLQALKAQGSSSFSRIMLSADQVAAFPNSFNIYSKSASWTIMDTTRASQLLSYKIKLPGPVGGEFLSLTPQVMLKNGDPQGIKLSYRISKDGQNWTEGKEISRFHEQDPRDDHFIGDMQFLSPSYRYVSVRMSILPGFGIEEIQEISLDLFDPGSSPEVPTAATREQTSTSACPCSIPTVVDRQGWNCPDGNSPSCSNPAIIPTTHLIVHHSAGSNSLINWSAAVLAIWNLHTVTNGWCDIGYNWLIDPNGVVYEGRGGGNDVRGAHFCGTNSGTMGVCLIGTFTNVSPTAAALRSLDSLLAWKACDSGLDPLGSGVHTASGLGLPRISGHRNGCSTQCPGNAFYPQLPAVRNNVQQLISTCGITALDRDEPRPGMVLSPNPTNGALKLSWSQMENGPSVLRLYDMSGQVLLQQSLSTNDRQYHEYEIELPTLSAGMYLLAVRTVHSAEQKWFKVVYQ